LERDHDHLIIAVSSSAWTEIWSEDLTGTRTAYTSD
jgi:hypothetical protein